MPEKMSFRVYLASDAQNDIHSIYQYVSDRDSPEKAFELYENIKRVCMELTILPLRGHVPPELQRIDVHQYLEVHFKPYRIIYQISDQSVFIHCILDGRRDLQNTLLKRLLV